MYDDELLESLGDELQLRAESLDDRHEALVLCLEKLPAPQRQLLEMRYALEQSIGQIERVKGVRTRSPICARKAIPAG